jgi:hypothetical protein
VPESEFPARQAVLSADSAVEIEDRQIEAWPRMSPAERLQVSREMTRAANELALADMRHRHPHATERECFLRLAAVRLGADRFGGSTQTPSRCKASADRCERSRRHRPVNGPSAIKIDFFVMGAGPLEEKQ